MLFWVHAAVAYLCYRLALTTSRKGLPTDTAIVPLIASSLLPDLIDKPLSFGFTAIPSRSLAHSVFMIGLVLGAAAYLSRRSDGATIAAVFGLGYLSHIGADLVDVLFIPRETVLFLLWPLITDYHHIGSVGDLLTLVRPTPYVTAQMLLTGLAILVWTFDGKPGYESVQNRRETE